MLELRTKKEQGQDAFTLAHGFKLVRYRNTTYMPTDYETGATDVTPDPDRTVWVPLNQVKLQRLAAHQFNTLFGTDAELRSFEFMVAQNCIQMDKTISSLLVRTSEGLRELDEDGELVPATGEFRPNCLVPMLNTDPMAKHRVFEWVVQILDSEEEAESLLSHLASALAPGWSAVKYVLLLGGGRNGKSLLLKMLTAVFGEDNVSNVTRQMIAEQKAPVMELNGKLLNIVFDGQKEYLKDSGAEKTLIAGEKFSIEAKYANVPVAVQTNALFIEGLQEEPKTRDKSSALQKRLVRFLFPNVYPLNHRFEKRMLAEDSLGAFLALLLDRYVKEDEVAERLAPTTKALELQIEHSYSNSPALQFLAYLEEKDAFGAEGLIGQPMSTLIQKFQSWRLHENDLGTWAEPDVQALFNPLLNTERKTERTASGPRKVRKITSFKDEAQAFLDSLKGDDDGATADAELLAALVED